MLRPYNAVERFHTSLKKLVFKAAPVCEDA
jgi:hypothetical protein